MKSRVGCRNGVWCFAHKCGRQSMSVVCVCGVKMGGVLNSSDSKWKLVLRSFPLCGQVFLWSSGCCLLDNHFNNLSWRTLGSRRMERSWGKESVNISEYRYAESGVKNGRREC
jgi:hypothetical protein